VHGSISFYWQKSLGKVFGYKVTISIVNSMRLFIDGAKLWAPIWSEAELAFLQCDLDKLVDWSVEWQLGFNVAKCRVMHISHLSQTTYYVTDSSGRVEVQSVSVENDLRVSFTHDSEDKFTMCQSRQQSKISCRHGLQKFLMVRPR